MGKPVHYVVPSRPTPRSPLGHHPKNKGPACGSWMSERSRKRLTVFAALVTCKRCITTSHFQWATQDRVGRMVERARVLASFTLRGLSDGGWEGLAVDVDRALVEMDPAPASLTYLAFMTLHQTAKRSTSGVPSKEPAAKAGEEVQDG